MKIKTVRQSLLPCHFHKYLRAVDELGGGYNLAATNIFLDNRMEFELWVDGGDHNGTMVTLHPDGTWGVTTEVVIGESQ